MAVVAESRSVPARWGWAANVRMGHSGSVRTRVGMTIDTRKLRVVGRDLVAIRADRTMMRDREPSVIKGCSCPRGRRVAGVAGRWIAGGDVVRDRTA